MKQIFLIISLSLVLGCSSVQHSLDAVSVGMEKGEVLESLGGPTLTKRRSNEDVWQYTFYDGDKKIVKELRFKGNKLTYKGEPSLPKSGQTAKDIDARNSHYPASGAVASQEKVDPKANKEKLEKALLDAKDNPEENAELPQFKEIQ